eukprot:10576798-Heterocapsa_arctica.AAC.1
MTGSKSSAAALLAGDSAPSTSCLGRFSCDAEPPFRAPCGVLGAARLVNPPSLPVASAIRVLGVRRTHS